MKGSLTVAFVCFVGVGCASPPKLRSTMNEALMGDRLGFTIELVDPSYGSTHQGKALLLYIYVRRQPDDYRRGFALELETAAVVLAAVAEIEEAARVAYVELHVVNQYGVMPPREKPLVGALTVQVAPQTLLELRHRKAGPEEYAQHWILVNGLKDQPDSRELLILPPSSNAPPVGKAPGGSETIKE